MQGLMDNLELTVFDAVPAIAGEKDFGDA